MLIVRLAREVETCQYFIEIFRVVNDEIIPFGLTGKETVYPLWSEPLLAQGLAFHRIKARLELRFELVPFFAVGILGSPRETIEFVDIQVRENDLERHVLNNAHAKFRGRKGKRDEFDVRPLGV